MNKQVAGRLALLTAELQQVEQEMTAALGDLRAPFSRLLQGQWRADRPLLCAAFVLAAGVGAADTPRLAQQRVHLGAAIEVLRLALAVHTQLLSATTTQPQIDRSRLGSTVLAGDFCFSRAAALAAKTGSPVVVDIFAQALQRVSEATLRGLFVDGSHIDAGDAAGFNVERELCLSGVAAANELLDLDAPERQADQQAAERLLDQWQNGWRTATADSAAPLLPDGAPPPPRPARWQALSQWLRTQ